MGCVAQQMKEQLVEPPYCADFAIGIGGLARFDEVLRRLLAGERGLVIAGEDGRYDLYYDLDKVKRSDSRSAYVAVSRGCRNFCTYCIVPFVRGPIRHREPKSVLAEVRQLVDQGFIEVCLLGQNVNNYRYENVEFHHLLEDVAQIEGLRRLRFITSNARDLTIETVRLMATPPLMPYISLPMQSGSDRILALMNRGYMSAEYLEKVSWIREIVGDAAISTDIMVGFPGESEVDFEATLDAVRQARFENIYSFKYSPRPFTKAAAFNDPIPDAVVRRRFQQLLDLQREIQLDRMLSFEGKVLDVLIDGVSKKDPNVVCGRAGQNIVVNLHHDRCRLGDLVKVRIEKANPHSLSGKVIGRAD